MRTALAKEKKRKNVIKRLLLANLAAALTLAAVTAAVLWSLGLFDSVWKFLFGQIR